MTAEHTLVVLLLVCTSMALGIMGAGWWVAPLLGSWHVVEAGRRIDGIVGSRSIPGHIAWWSTVVAYLLNVPFHLMVAYGAGALAARLLGL